MRKFVKSGFRNRKQNVLARLTFQDMTDCAGLQSKSTNPDGISCPDRYFRFSIRLFVLPLLPAQKELVNCLKLAASRDLLRPRAAQIRKLRDQG